MSDKKLSTEPYKGTRDFYPEEMAIRKYMFKTVRDIVERFGYVEYDSSPIEETALYAAKSGEEIVKEQTYSFTDRGGREVTLRPEMTPTLARMVAARRRELGFPLRWYSIPNLFRYEQPQKGRLREHYQINVDIFGVSSLEADAEIILIASEILKSFGATDEDFEIRINNRKIFRSLSKVLNLPDETSHKLIKLLDKEDKLSKEKFEEELEILVGDKTQKILALIKSRDVGEFISALGNDLPNIDGVNEIEEVLISLKSSGVSNVRFSPSLVRGLDYYTGIVFEIFDVSKENRRAICGGGRYDDLLSIFGEENVPASGFGMGDVPLQNFLNEHELLPQGEISTDLYICKVGENIGDFVQNLAQFLRKEGLNVAIDFTERKVGDQIKTADKKGISFVLVVGENELKEGVFPVKNLSTGEEVNIKKEEIAPYIKNY